jgi:2-keto-4-pentenoate hydratase/2-oxohepta-3-ene-1,7-dioic acid hydratase in catechol pathway
MRLITCRDADPGDVIATGMPAGVGIVRRPPRLLQDGDIVTVTVERVGELTNTCRTGPAMEG